MSINTLEVCRESAAAYLGFLKNHKKGIDRNKASVKKQDAGVFSLEIAKPLFSADSSELSLELDSQIYDKGDFPVVEYDQDNLQLFVQPASDDLCAKLSNANEVFVVTDFAFLVSRICELYRDQKKLSYPLPKPTCLSASSFDESKLSDEQKRAISTIFQNGQSYIWGAPGTGKTRYVLSRCLLAYLRQNDPKHKVIVLAPTNNALEQVLYGILEELKEKDMDLCSILRLGFPTHAFSLQYPNICEDYGIEKRIADYKQQLVFKQKLLDYRSFVQRYTYLQQNVIPAFERAEEALLALHDISKITSKYKRDETRLASDILSSQNSIRNRKVTIALLQQRVVGISLRVLFKRKIQKLEEEIEQQNAILEEEESHYLSLVNDRVAIADQFTQLEKEREKHQKQLDYANAIIKNTLRSIQSLAPIAKVFDAGDFHAAKKAINQKIEQGTQHILAKKAIFESYDDVPDSTIQEQIAAIENTIKKLAEQTRDGRIKKASIIAATVDTFFSAIPPESLQDAEYSISHIFLDEAGYCSLIKGTLLTAYNCPITLLGDHMQLPPVCEMDIKEIISYEENHIILPWATSAIYLEDMFSSESFSSFFERIADLEEPSMSVLQKSNLTRTYRFDNELATVLDKYVYKNGFSSALMENTISIVCINAPFLSGKEKHQSISEAKKISDLIPTLTDTEYVILTPYRNQRKAIQESCFLSPLEKSKRILTVHASQGREWDTVILSVADPSAGWFTNSKLPHALRLLNTAVSRTKKQLIIVCNISYWANQDDQFITKLIERAVIH